MYNPNAGDHHYTVNKGEKDHLVKLGWRYEGIAFYSASSDNIPIYREYNPNAISGTHNFTSNLSEHKYLTSIGWHNEGIGWYGLK